MHTVKVSNPDELLSALPHSLGFRPEESLIVMPVSGGPGVPLARIDLPRTPADQKETVEALGGVYGHAQQSAPGMRVAVLGISEDRAAADIATAGLADRLGEIGVPIQMRLWGNDTEWADLETGMSGARTVHAASIVDAELALAGRPAPAASRDALAQSMVGDRQPVASLLPQALQARAQSTPAAERSWALARLDQFHADGLRLDDPDATRLLVAITDVHCRDALWEDMSDENAITHSSLWTDLTRRAPDEVRTPAATMLGFSRWLNGDGAGAWCALDQIPPGQDYTMANLLGTTLQCAVNPATWKRMREGHLHDVSECYVPQDKPVPPPSQRIDPDAPSHQPPAR